MSTRARAASLVLLLVLTGRLLDHLDLRIENQPQAVAVRSGAETQAPISLTAPPPGAAEVAPGAGPSGESANRGKASRPDVSSGSQNVPINRANAEQLRKIPGVGPVLAERILETRRISGPFQSAADLMKVRGIGRRTAERLAQHISFD